MGSFEVALDALQEPLCESCPGRIYAVQQEVQFPKGTDQGLNRIGAVAVCSQLLKDVARFSVANDIAGCDGPIKDPTADFGVACGALLNINLDPTAPIE